MLDCLFPDGDKVRVDGVTRLLADGGSALRLSISGQGSRNGPFSSESLGFNHNRA